MTMMAEYVEREWKLLVPDEATFRALREIEIPANLKGTQWRCSQLDNRYFDTDERALGALGGALRLRRCEGRTFLTLKYGHRRDDALHRMCEVEEEVDHFEWRDPWVEPFSRPMERLFSLLGMVKLEPIVRFETERFERRFEDAEGAGATLVLDRMRHADGRVDLELELELDADVAGNSWSRWITEVRGRFGLEPSTRTKLARALAR